MSFILNLNNNKKKVFAGLIMFAGLNTFSQTIVNTENMSTKTDSVFSLISSIEGNWSSGNIELIQINSANQIALSCPEITIHKKVTLWKNKKKHVM